MSILATTYINDWEYAARVYETCNMQCSVPVAEVESEDYAASRFTLDGSIVLYREAKITPTKTGLFVTLWRRSVEGPIQPFEHTDLFDFVVICTRNQTQIGHFVFPKSVLVSKGIVSALNKDGKRGFRVYPPWSETHNKQAQQTQHWQSEFFIDLSPGEATDTTRLHKLFAANG